MLRCIAVDDEVLALGLLEEYIRQVPFLELVATCGDAFEAIKVLQDKPVDLVFMDIQMPGLTGLQFIQSLTVKPMVILITAYKKFAPEGFDLDVIDYLIKPMGLERFMKACHKANELHQLKAAAAASAPAADYFFVNVDYSLVKVLFSDILWIEGSGDYVKFHLKSTSRPLIVRMSAKTLEAELPADQFIRIHRSYTIAISSITAIRKNSVFINELELPVGETYRDKIYQITKREL